MTRSTRTTKVGDIRKQVRRVSDLYNEDDLLEGRFNTPKVYAWFQQRHRTGYKQIDDDGVFHHGEHEWKVPIGVRICVKKPLLWRDVAKKYPWFVTWKGKTGKRYKKYFMSPYAGMAFIAEKAQYVDPHASLVHRNGFDIPKEFRGKIPLPWRWCPRCMTARRFKPIVPEETFYANRKEWIQDKARYEYRDRKLRLMHCTHCGLTNRDGLMRRANQPWEVRRFRQGARRARRRR